MNSELINLDVSQINVQEPKPVLKRQVFSPPILEVEEPNETRDLIESRIPKNRAKDRSKSKVRKKVLEPEIAQSTPIFKSRKPEAKVMETSSKPYRPIQEPEKL